MSWVICRKSDGKAVVEVWNKSTADAINTEKYKAVPILEYLQSLNKKDRLPC